MYKPLDQTSFLMRMPYGWRIVLLVFIVATAVCGGAVPAVRQPKRRQWRVFE